MQFSFALRRAGRSAAAAALVLLATGCAMQAPAYAPSIDNIERIKKLGAPMAVGTFGAAQGATGADSIGLRGSSMVSPVGGNFAAYLAEALRQELALAGKFDGNAEIKIGGLLVKNDIAAGGISTNSGEIEARFTVQRGTATPFNKMIRAEASWESSFMGAVAIPKAQQQYPLLVQQLLKSLLSDPEFVAALK